MEKQRIENGVPATRFRDWTALDRLEVGQSAVFDVNSSLDTSGPITYRKLKWGKRYMARKAAEGGVRVWRTA